MVWKVNGIFVTNCLYMGMIDDCYFRFPVKVYDQIELRRQEQQEELGGKYGEVEEPMFVSGWARLPHSELLHLHWHEGFTPGKDKEDIEDEGFDLTIVYSDKHGQMISTWNMKEFEKKLEEFLDRNRDKVYIASIKQ